MNRLIFGFVLGLAACASSNDDTEQCGTCNGNVAVDCALKHGCDDTTDYDYSTKTRTDCGSKTCKVEQIVIECTSQGSAFKATETRVSCE